AGPLDRRAGVDERLAQIRDPMPVRCQKIMHEVHAVRSKELLHQVNLSQNPTWRFDAMPSLPERRRRTERALKGTPPPHFNEDLLVRRAAIQVISGDRQLVQIRHERTGSAIDDAHAVATSERAWHRRLTAVSERADQIGERL